VINIFLKWLKNIFVGFQEARKEHFIPELEKLVFFECVKKK